MPNLGNIPIPVITASGTFPLKTNYPHSYTIEPQVVTHAFATGEGRVEQRFYLGAGARRFWVRRDSLSLNSRKALVTWWESNQGALGAFTYAAPNPDGTTTDVVCRFADTPLSLEALTRALTSVGIELIEVPTTGATYTSSKTVTRFPDAALAAQLVQPTQTVFPLITIRPLEDNYPALPLSDRLVTVNSITYQPRLVDWSGIGQGIEGEADRAQFSLGNADEVLTGIVNEVDLLHADVSFCVFHVGTGTTGTLIELWRGHVVDWDLDDGQPLVRLTCGDGLYEVTRPYPRSAISRTCTNPYNDGFLCPAAAQGINVGTACDKGFDTPAGCRHHKMENYFAGLIATPQSVRTKDNSSGLFGLGRSPLTSTSILSDSLYGKPRREIYTDTPMTVAADLAAYRDEGDFANGLGVVGAGPLELSTDPTQHFLDGQRSHGPGSLGLRISNGNHPNPDPFSLGEGSNGVQRYGPERAAGTAFVELRKTDEKGLQVSKLDEHRMEVTVEKGLKGWVWTSATTRVEQPLINPIWIAVNAYLKHLGLQHANATVQATRFLVADAIASATICNEVVAKLFGNGTETQFRFRGFIQEQKPLRDWLTEILANCLGYYTFVYGKLKLGIRVNASSASAFTLGNILWRSLQLSPLKPDWNQLTVNFADEEFGGGANAVHIEAPEHQTWLGKGVPVILSGSLNLAGTSTKSQAGRIAKIRLCEELGGATLTEWKTARRGGWKTTILALDTEPGMVVSLTHPKLPGGTAKKFRILRWQLEKDWSIAVQVESVTDATYDLVTGPKPVDVPVPELPAAVELAPAEWGFRVTTDFEGKAYLQDLYCGTNALTIARGDFEVLYCDEATQPLIIQSANQTATSTTLSFGGSAPPVGSLLAIRQELLRVESIDSTVENGGTCTVERGQFGTTAVPHVRILSTVGTLHDKQAITIGTGLAIQAGQRLVAANGDQEEIGSYDATSGVCRLLKPIASLTQGQQVYTDPRIYVVQTRQEVLTFAPRFFRSVQRFGFRHPIDLPYAGLVAVQGRLTNQSDHVSDPVTVRFTSHYAARLRTGGSTGYVFTDEGVPTGANLIGPHVVQAARSFSRCYAEADTAEEPLPAPNAPASPTPQDYNFGAGSIALSGTVNATLQISVAIHGGSEMRIPLWRAKDHSVTSSTTLAVVAQKLTDWLNGDPLFSAQLAAQVQTGTSTIQIQDRAGRGGALDVDTEGGITATETGLTSTLNVRVGRRYACCFVGNGYRTPLSPFSPSTGPTGSAARVRLAGLPVSSDGRFTSVEIYATPDGSEETPRLLGAVTSGVTESSDVLTETALLTAPVYPGTSMPPRGGDCLIRVLRHGDEWIRMRVPEDQGASAVVHGLALQAVAAGTELAVHVENEAEAPVRVRVVFE